MSAMFVDGGPRDGSAPERLEVQDPSTGRVVGTVPAGTAEDVDAAVRAALAAFPAWSDTPAARRGELLHQAAGLVRDHREELAGQLTQEQGKPLREARGEIGRCVETLEHYAGLARSLRGGYVPDLDEGAYGLILRRPLGVVGAIVPWNFPTTLLANKLGPALVTGNTVVAKPAETTPLTTLRIAELLHRGRHPGRGVQRGHRDRAGRRCRAGRAPAGPQDRVHRLDPGRQADHGGGRRAPQAGHARTRRLRPDDHLRRRRPGPRGERRQRRPVLQLRPGVPGDQAAVRVRARSPTR